MASVAQIKKSIADILVEKLPDVDVLYGEFPKGKNIARSWWVSVDGGDAETYELSTGEGVNIFTFNLTFNVVCSSGPHHKSPYEADTAAYKLAGRVAVALTGEVNLRLGNYGVQSAIIEGVRRLTEWDTDKSVSVSVVLTVRAEGL